MKFSVQIANDKTEKVIGVVVPNLGEPGYYATFDFRKRAGGISPAAEGDFATVSDAVAWIVDQAEAQERARAASRPSRSSAQAVDLRR